MTDPATPREASDEELVEALQGAAAGDLRAFDVLVERHQARVLTNCRYISGSPGWVQGTSPGTSWRDSTPGGRSGSASPWRSPTSTAPCWPSRLPRSSLEKEGRTIAVANSVFLDEIVKQ